ncbi:MAG TPA: class I SAM-dependent methyltransferase [Micromonosporaceae bacterium]|nr:class I SAM-dependent methyltransferase [Micromonosporaceae bacterium]
MNAAADATVELDESYRTRPGTPMVGPYSVNQMDNFYAALAVGEVKPTGVMNLAQRLYIAERCSPGARVADVCCGRGLQLPVLYRYAADIGSYTGLDISPENLAEARQTLARLDERYGGRPFDVALVRHDVAQPWPDDVAGFDVAVYTSALEHLPRDLAVASLRHTIAALRPGGWLFLSTPNTPGESPRPLQHRVHVYEWNTDELIAVLTQQCGLLIEERVGLLSPSPDQLTKALFTHYGAGAVEWYHRMRATVPAALLDTVAAAAVPEVASEVLYVCRRPQ